MAKCSVGPGKLLGLTKGRKMRNFFTHGQTPQTARGSSLVLRLGLVRCGLVAPSVAAVAELDVTPSIMLGKHYEKSDFKETWETRSHRIVDRINCRGARGTAIRSTIKSISRKTMVAQDRRGACQAGFPASVFSCFKAKR
ncbi:hypothetical protein NW767_014829 [Fusarium falciforme]|nr:hypothetical protein NW767_014829 [Fusarium falciforme]